MRSFFEARAHDALRAAAEVAFPPNGFGAPNFAEARVIERTKAFIEELPPAQGRLLLLLFVVVELGAPILVGGFTRFSKATPERRLQAMLRWRTTRFYPVRLIGEGMKATLTMMYAADPSVLSHMKSDDFEPSAPREMQVKLLSPALRRGIVRSRRLTQVKGV